MNKILSIAALFVLCSAYAFSNENTFEGNLTYTTTKDGSTTGKLLLAVKNNLVAVNPGIGPQMVIDVNTGNLMTVVKQGEQKSLIKVNLGVLGNMEELPDFLGPFSNYFGTNGRSATEVKVTDEVKTINGYKSTKYIVKDQENTATIWAAGNFPFNFSAILDLLKVQGLNENFKKAFPMQGSVKNAKTGETTAFNVAIDKKALDPSFFEMPELPVMDMTPLVKQMLEKNDPKQIKAILDQFIPR